MDRWSQLSLKDKSDLMSLYIQNGISSLEEIKKHYNSYQVGGPVSEKTPNFVQRFNEGNKRDIPFQGGHATHLLSYAERDGKYYVYPEVQPTDYNNSDSPLQYYGRDWRVAFDRAYDNNDYLEFDTEEAARNYSENYKKVPSTGAVLNGRNRGNYNILDYMRGYATGGHLYQEGGPDDEDKIYAASSVYKAMPDITITAERPAWQHGLTNYDWTRARQYYSNPDGTINSRGMMFLKDVASKSRTGQSNFMRDVNKLSYIPSAAVGAIGAIPAAAGLVASLPVVAEAAAPYIVPAIKAITPQAIGRFGLGMTGMAGTNQLVKDNTNYNSWGDMLNQVIFGQDDAIGSEILEFTNPGALLGGAGDLLNQGVKLVERTPQFRHLKRSWNRTYNNSYYPETYVENVLNAKYPKSEYPDDVNIVENFKVRDKVADYKKGIKEQLDRDKDKLTSYLQQPERFTQEDVTRINNLYKISPEYVEFLMENPTLKPFAQSTLDSFIARQSRSVRGIHVPESEVNNVFDLVYDKNGKLRSFKDNNFIELTSDSKGNLIDFQIKPKTSEMIAEEYLTIPPVSGPDRLGNAGLYTSNGRFIADKFMRPETSAPETSYIGELRYNFNIDRAKPIEEQLRQYRNSIDNWFDLGITDAEAGMIEAPYTRSTGETSEGIYERSVNPSGRNPVVQLEKLNDFGTGNENLHGRWGIENGDADLDLFIPKRFSQDYRDFIRFTRNAKQQSTMEYRTENTTRHTAREEVRQHVKDRETKYRRLQTQHKENKDKFQRYSQASTLGVGGTGALYGLFALGKKGTPRTNWYIEHEEELSKITRKEIGPLPSENASDAEWEAYMEKEEAIFEREYKKARKSKKSNSPTS